MSEAQHTPGPWGLSSAIHTWVMAGPIHVATIPRSADGDWSPANARLIAAAPDLLDSLYPEVLEVIADEIERLGQTTRAGNLRSVAQEQYAAIRKATGDAVRDVAASIETRCPVCDRHVMCEPQVAVGYLAKCGRRLTRIAECGRAEGCDRNP